MWKTIIRWQGYYLYYCSKDSIVILKDLWISKSSKLFKYKPLLEQCKISKFIIASKLNLKL